MTPGRSRLLRAALPEVPRRRRFALRALGLAAVGGAVALLVAAVLGRWFDPAGPGHALYRLHDDIALPLFARLWTAPFPGGLVWLLPLAVLGMLMVMEGIGLGQPLRRGQVAILRRLTAGRGGLLVAWHRGLRWLGLASHLARVVVAEDLARAEERVWWVVLRGVGRPEPDLARLAALWSDLGTADDGLRLAELEALAWVAGADAPPLAARLQARGLAPIRPLPLAAILAAAALLQRGEGPADAARLAIGAALGTVQGGRAEGLAFWDAWAAARLAGAPGLAVAEAAIAFETWAALAEARVVAPVAPGLLAEAFDETARPRPRGEIEAARAAGHAAGGRA